MIQYQATKHKIILAQSHINLKQQNMNQPPYAKLPETEQTLKLHREFESLYSL